VDLLWAPWRMTYIGGGAPAPPAPESSAGQPTPGPHPGPAPAPACIFCAPPAADPRQDRANLLLWRGAQAFVILNLYPYNAGHLLVVPYRHLHDVTQLTAAESGEIMALLQQMVQALNAAYRPQGFNVGMNLGAVAGAGIADHLHLHIVPRWSGDTNFMPVVGQTKVLPEDLAQTYDRLRQALSGG